MGLLSSIFSRKDAAPAEAPEQARTRARRRLIGAAVLVGLGVLGFPLLFETQPRPIAVDVPIEIPRKDAVPPLSVPAPTPRPAPASAAARRDDAASEPRADAGRDMAPPTSAPPAASSPGAATGRPKPPATPARSTKPPAAAEKPPAPPPAAPAAPGGARIAVQVGAYADADAAREARQRLEKLGLRAYTQAVETDAGKRIRVRVGPFATREQAEQAAARIKAAGLPAAVIAP